MGGTSTAPGSRSTAAILALYVLVGACVLAIGADVRRILVARDLRAGRAAVDALLSADQLVRLATVLLALAAVVAAVLVGRWLGVARRDAGVLGGLSSPGAVRAAAVLVGLAALAQLLAWTVLGPATDVADRERIDALRAGATLLAAVAAGAVILAVARETAGQDARAHAAGIPRTPERLPRDRTGAAGGGLPVVSEEQARRRDDGA